ncbi:MAG TPA: HD domain-containing phosphohydrolase, partial [Solirubrobacteraceae bacterium]|nr:HD domain-containing phosphohydrolase [Solirubrobacteraceae bacterium]
FCVIAALPAGDVAHLDALARAALSEHGEAFSVTASCGSALLPADARTPSEALGIADRRMYAEKGSGSRASAAHQSAEVLLQVLCERSSHLGTYLDDVTELCGAVGGALAVPEEEMSHLLRAASLHDIGNAAIPEALLDKPGPLDEHEWAYIRSHTLIGERILAAAPALAPAAKLVRSSHERFDGGGYPDGLAGEQIPLGARIIAACAAFYAMTARRPHRSPMSVECAQAELRAGAGTQFDATVVDALMEVLRDRVMQADGVA